MKHAFPATPASLPVLALVSATVLGLFVACGSNNTVTVAGDAGPAPCDPTQCAAQNQCIADADGVVACRLPCKAHSDCPFDTQCQVSSPQSYCVKDTTVVTAKAGQWGTSCLPQNGIANKACDTQGGFGCYGTGPTDALAYCTLLSCMQDLDCAGGYYCQAIDDAPNVQTDVRTFGKTHKICVKHEYCSPCAGDLDCPVIDGKQSRCVSDDLGGKFCATQCKISTDCRLDALCVTGLTGDATSVCRPRAHHCKGDGSLCSPCRSDADCTNGFCIKGAYSPERFCSAKSSATCVPPTPTAANPTPGSIVKGACPAFKYLTTQIGCQSASDDPSIPKDQCIGLVDFGSTGDIGCYTEHPPP